MDVGFWILVPLRSFSWHPPIREHVVVGVITYGLSGFAMPDEF
jgi:hypothetical protein